ncbi:hypothetical protein CBS101457_006389 [Exobasidium rhododendri]|nr:hypothetical protein CBS101457_006389 [Exobasidium rhododendri]
MRLTLALACLAVGLATAQASTKESAPGASFPSDDWTRLANLEQDQEVKGAGQDTPSSFYPLNPPSIPLAVKSPYLSAWGPSGQNPSATPPNRVGNQGYLAGQDSSFWTSSYGADGEHRMGWTGIIQIDKVSYQWMGDSFGKRIRQGKNAKQIAMTYTATRSIFQFEADSVLFNVTFMTPIWPNDYLRQSLPLSYMHFELDRSSAVNRSVQIYTDIDERWTTGHDYDYERYPSTMQWVDNNKGSSIYFVQRTNPQALSEYRQRAEWGSSVYAARRRKGMTSRNNNNVVAQIEFVDTGNLTYDHNPVGGPDNSFAYTINFDGKGGNEGLFAIGHMRTPYVNYIKRTPSSNSTVPKSFLQDRFGYWMSKYPNFSDAVSFFVDDFENALAHCKKLDQQIAVDSQAAVGGGLVGEMYSAITQLSVRQAFGTIEITVPYNDTSRSYNTSDTLIFLKEISSNGDMSTVDVFFPQFPLFSYFNPDLLRDIMKPIFEYTESGLYPNKWCVHDLGVYPSAFGHNDGKDEPMQVEESGNMILMTLHWAQLVGKKAAKPFLKQHYKIMQQWAGFLITDSLIPAEQLSTDDFAGQLANQSNLAIKGIQGIAAMGHIATWLNKTEDAKIYKNVSSTYIQAFYGYAINKNDSHVKLSYQDDASWGTLYNLVFDRLLNLQLVAEEIYDKQDAFYPTKLNKYGTPLDSRFSWQKTDWAMFASATAGTPSTRDLWIENLYKFVSDGKTDAPFTDLLETRTGDFPKQPYSPSIRFIARPVVGGHLIHLALAKANKANKVKKYAYGPPIKKGKKHSLEASALSIMSVNREQGEENIEPFLSVAADSDEANEIDETFDWKGGKQETFVLRGSRPAVALP